jgi:hypothetical protein
MTVLLSNIEWQPYIIYLGQMPKLRLITIVFLQAPEPSACLKKTKITRLSQGSHRRICTARARKLAGLTLYPPWHKTNPSCGLR